MTHSQRKYLSHSHILANSPAKSCIRRWWYRSAAGSSPPYRLTIVAHPPSGFMQTERICLPYSFVERLSAHRNMPLPVCFCERKCLGGTERPPLPSALVLDKGNDHVNELTVGGSLLQLHPGHIVQVAVIAPFPDRLNECPHGPLHRGRGNMEVLCRLRIRDLREELVIVLVPGHIIHDVYSMYLYPYSRPVAPRLRRSRPVSFVIITGAAVSCN